MKIFNTIKVELSRSIMNPLFFAAIFLTCILFFMSGYEEFFIYAPKMQYADVFHFFDFLRNVGTFETMLILCCAIPYTVSFCADYNSSYLRLLKYRTGEKNYIISRILACSVSGGLTVSLGMLLFIGILAFQYPMVDVNGGAYQSILMRIDYDSAKAFEMLLMEGNYILYYLSQLSLFFLVGAFWSVVGLVISSILPNPFVALFSPYLLYFFQSIILEKLPTHFNTMNIITGNYQLGNDMINFMYANIFIILLILLCGFIFGYFCKRRMRDELH